MAAREIVIWPNPILSRASEPVAQIDETIQELVADMKDTMLSCKEGAAGLAAPQIGVNKRVFLADIPPEANDGNGTKGIEAFINPEFLVQDGKMEWEEGCLSIPGEVGPMTRYSHVVMRYLDIQGVEREVDAVNYLAGCFQHEMDHLDGKLWVDYQSQIRRDLIRKKMHKLQKNREINTVQGGDESDEQAHFTI